MTRLAPLPNGARSDASIGAVFANGLGDAVLALPALRALKSRFPQAPIVVPSSSQLCTIFDEFRDDLVSLKFGPGKEFEVEELAGLLPCEGIVAFYTSWDNASLQAWLTRTKDQLKSVGITESFGEAQIPSTGHYFSRYFAISKAIDDAGPFDLYAYPHRSREWARFEAELGPRLAELGDYWVLHPDTKGYKILPSEFWLEVVRLALDQDRDRSVVVVGKDHREFVARFPGQERLILTPANFALCTYLVTHADRFCGVDSCFLHYADLQRVPSLGLFRGGANQARWGLHLTNPSDAILIADDEVPDPEQVVERLARLNRSSWNRRLKTPQAAH